MRVLVGVSWAKVLALVALIAAVGLLVYFVALPPAGAQATVDYDSDDDGLIDVSTTAQFLAMGQDLDGNGVPANTSTYAAAFPNRDTATTTRMGCPSGTCAGYELMADLTFGATSSNWGVGNRNNPFNTVFEGNGRTITGFNHVSGNCNCGLFGTLGGSGIIRNLGVIDPEVSATVFNRSGGLVGGLISGAVVQSSYVKGGSITANGNSASVGGLVGFLNGGTIRASYSTAAISTSGTRSSVESGGLVGKHQAGSIIASYAAGTVTAPSGGTGNETGGLVGQREHPAAVITNSFWDTQATGQTNREGQVNGGTVSTTGGYTTLQLQGTTDYDGIYANWNVNVGGDLGTDPWYFGTAWEYPQPAYLRPSEPAVDYDADDDNLIDVSTAEQLYAIRYDVDGNGDPTDGDPYIAAFPGRATSTPGRMGCPGTCAGYELTADVTFPAEAGPLNPWKPIGSFATTLNGQGRAISGANVSVSSGDAGFFSTLNAAARIRDLRVVNFNVTSTNTGAASNGTLAGFVSPGAVISSVAVDGGSVTFSAGGSNVGGLAGNVRGSVLASYASAAVTASGTASSLNAGGLVGNLNTAGARITASYATGVVGGTPSGANVHYGGLVGNWGSGTIITDGYCDSQSTGQNCVGSGTGNGNVSGQSTSSLQSTVGYTGIYADWNIDLDADTFLDYPWNFRANNQYPVPNTPAQRAAAIAAVTIIDYDTDDDNLIDIMTVAQLDAMRYDVNGDGVVTDIKYAAAFPDRPRVTAAPGVMGCPATCAGYELGATLVGAAGNALNDWTPIPGFATTFDGNSWTILNGNITVTSASNSGLFANLTASARIRDVGLVNFTVVSTSPGAQSNGILAGFVSPTAVISTSWVSGGSLTISTNNSNAGGLAGNMQGRVLASYSTAAVTGSGSAGTMLVGGLVGNLNTNTASITASYAAGAVTSTAANAGGLVGTFGTGSTITNSYCDTTATGQTSCVGTGTGSGGATGYGTSDLQTPTGYTGIYAAWNIDLSGDSFEDFPWNFQANNQYPIPNTAAQRAAALAAAPIVDYDADDDNLIEITTAAQLDAMRYDLDGNGLPLLSANYIPAFPNRPRVPVGPGVMGCPGTCAGYELMADLAAASDNALNAWTPIVGFATVLDGNGRTISGGNITVISGNAGMFADLTGAARVRDVGLVNFTVVSTNTTAASNGILVGFVAPNAIITGVSIQGGSIAISTNNSNAGGLAGNMRGQIRASYSTAAVTGSGSATTMLVGGLVGNLNASGARIIASYAAGAVTSTAANAGGLVGTWGLGRRSRTVIATLRPPGSRGALAPAAAPAAPRPTRPAICKRRRITPGFTPTGRSIWTRIPIWIIRGISGAAATIRC